MELYQKMFFFFFLLFRENTAAARKILFFYLVLDILYFSSQNSFDRLPVVFATAALKLFPDIPPQRIIFLTLSL